MWNRALETVKCHDRKPEKIFFLLPDPSQTVTKINTSNKKKSTKYFQIFNISLKTSQRFEIVKIIVRSIFNAQKKYKHTITSLAFVYHDYYTYYKFSMLRSNINSVNIITFFRVYII